MAGLTADELSVLIDRYATYEPVLDAEVESSGMRVSAKVHADNGDYAVADAAILKALRAPREHALVITLAAGRSLIYLMACCAWLRQPRSTNTRTCTTSAPPAREC